MFFELALAGIGGNTIHQVKTNLTRAEVEQWAEYINRRGSLNVGRRVEQAIGHFIAYYFNSKLDKKDQYYPVEFMPNEDDVEIGFEQMMAQMQD